MRWKPPVPQVQTHTASKAMSLSTGDQILGSWFFQQQQVQTGVTHTQTHTDSRIEDLINAH